VYVLFNMVVTFPTCHVERSPLKAPAVLNTATHMQQQKEKSKDKNGRRKKETAKIRPDLREEGKTRVYVLACMFFTFSTCHLERSPLKSPAPENTAPQQQRTKQSPRIQMEWEKKEERALFKNRISAATERRRKKEASEKRPDLGELEKERE
jgi:hypothetical protein